MMLVIAVTSTLNILHMVRKHSHFWCLFMMHISKQVSQWEDYFYIVILNLTTSDKWSDWRYADWKSLCFFQAKFHRELKESRRRFFFTEFCFWIYISCSWLIPEQDQQREERTWVNLGQQFPSENWGIWKDLKVIRNWPSSS